MEKYTRQTEKTRDEGGAALVIALFIITVLTVLGLLTLNTSIVEVKMAANQKISSQAFYAADAGLERGLSNLIQDFENDSGAGSPWGNSTYAVAGTVTETANSGSAAFDVNVRSMDMYLNSPAVWRLNFTGGTSVGKGSYQLYLYKVSPTEVYLMSYATGLGGVAAVEYHLKVEDLSPYNNAIFTGAGITGHFQGSVDLAGSIYSRGNISASGNLGFYNNYADAHNGLGGLSGLLPAVTDLDAKIRVKGGDFTLGGSASVGTSSADGAYSNINVDGTMTWGSQTSYYDEFSSEVPDVPMPTILDGLNGEFGSAFISNCIASEGYGGSDSNIAREIYEDWATGTGCFATSDSVGVVINSDVTISGSTASFSNVDAYGNGISWSKPSKILTIQGNVVINGALSLGGGGGCGHGGGGMMGGGGGMEYIAVGPASSTTGSDPEAGATLFVRDSTTINGDFKALGGYLKGGTNTNSLGVVTPADITFTGHSGGMMGGMMGGGGGGDAYTGFYYAATQINFNKQAKFGGTVIGGVVNFAQVPDMFQVPALKNYLPPGVPGGYNVLSFTDRDWKRVY